MSHAFRRLGKLLQEPPPPPFEGAPDLAPQFVALVRTLIRYYREPRSDISADVVRWADGLHRETRSFEAQTGKGASAGEGDTAENSFY